MPNTLNAGSGQGLKPVEEAGVVNTTEEMATGFFRQRHYSPRRGAHINWPFRSGLVRCHAVFRFSTHVTIPYAVIQIIWCLALQLKTLNAWLRLVGCPKVLDTRMLGSAMNKYAKFANFVEKGCLTVKSLLGSGSAKAMFATFITAGGA